jgi:hypothetical protein
VIPHTTRLAVAERAKKQVIRRPKNKSYCDLSGCVCPRKLQCVFPQSRELLQKVLREAAKYFRSVITQIKANRTNQCLVNMFSFGFGRLLRNVLMFFLNFI